MARPRPARGRALPGRALARSIATVEAAGEAADGADGLVAFGGGSAIDTGKAVSAARDLQLVSVPTTYAGAEWTPFYGMRDEERG